jgi:type VII secretion protein EccB
LFHTDHRDSYLINAASLDWPRIGRYGIEGAPDNLPKPDRLTTDPWTVCSRVSADGAGVSVLFAGIMPPGGRDLGEEAVLVADPQGGRHLIWQGRRHPIRDDLVLTALRVPSLTPLPVGLAWLDTLAVGPEFSKIDIPAAGQPTSWLPAVKVGQVVYVGNQLHAVTDPESLSPISDLQARLLIAAYAAVNAGPPPTLDELSAIGRTKPPLQTRLPATAPRVQPVPADAGLCATAADATDARAIRVGVPLPQFSPRSGPAAPTPVADVVLVPPSKGILVRARSSAGATGTLFLVTDQSIAYRISSDEAAKRLGYESAPVVDLPTALVARVPLGPDLDHQAAGAPLAGTG